MCIICLCKIYCRYGFDYGNVHVVMMSTEHDFTADSEQLQFLDDHMKKVNREKTPWLIFAGHRPMYIDSTNNDIPDGDQPVASLLRKHVEPLLKVNISILASYKVCIGQNLFRNTVLTWHCGVTIIHTRELVVFIMKLVQLMGSHMLSLEWLGLVLPTMHHQ